MPSRDELRSASIGKGYDARPRLVEVNGKEFEVRAITIAEKSRCRQRSLIEQHSGAIGAVPITVVDPARFGAHCVVASCFVPGTDGKERIYEEADLETLLNQPTGGWYEDLHSEVMRTIHGLDVAKNSEATKGGS